MFAEIRLRVRMKRRNGISPKESDVRMKDK